MQLLLTNLFASSSRAAILETTSFAMWDSFLAAQLGSGEIMGLISVIAGLIVGAVVGMSALYFHHRKNQMWHETARLALEKGQPVPPMPLRDEELALRPPPGVSFTEWHQAKLAESRGHEFKAGLVLAAIGAGLYLIMGWTAGAIPGFIGVALLINALIARRSSRCGPTTESNPPQS